jgi:hypothetical protein
MLAMLGCTVTNLNIETVKVGELRNESQVVERGDAETVKLYVKMSTGQLHIAGGADELLNADITYNVAAWEPKVHYEVDDDGEGRLTIRQPSTDKVSLRKDTRYEWDLQLSDDVPLDMRIECGAGESDLDLGSLDVTDLDIKQGAGDVNLDLSGNTRLQRLEFDIGAGDADLNLAGEWDHDVDVDIQGGLGALHLRLPEDIGVRVNVTKGLGDIDVSGLYDRDTYYANEAYDTADVTLEISLQTGIGRITLEVVE